MTRSSRKVPGTNLAWGELGRLFFLVGVVAWLFTGLLTGAAIRLGWLQPLTLYNWIVLFLLAPAGWGALLSALVDARTLLGRPIAEDPPLQPAMSILYYKRKRTLHTLESSEGGWLTPEDMLFNNATEPAPFFETEPNAWLVLIDDNQHLPQKLPLLSQGREIRIGRRPKNCDLVLDDKRVSRFHATIIEKHEGFYIRDQASAGGTYVNRQKVSIGERLLRHGDIINFNVIAYRFELNQTQESPTVTFPSFP